MNSDKQVARRAYSACSLRHFIPCSPVEETARLFLIHATPLFKMESDAIAIALITN